MKSAYFKRFTLVAAAFGAAATFAMEPAAAQRLSDGDYELCSVYDRDGEFAGYDSACLAEQRAATSYYERRAERLNPDPAYGPYFCPHWANQGRGYNVYSTYGTYAYATADAPVNGRLCTPRPVNYQSSG
ncbi:MAG: hypothetical protein RIE56_10400, partial [Amphiplicatus sp.]